MKLRVAILPLIVFAVFGYGVSVTDRATDGAQKPLQVEAVKEVVKADLAKFKPSDKFVYNQ